LDLAFTITMVYVIVEYDWTGLPREANGSKD
jgi:hypothetical protein